MIQFIQPWALLALLSIPAILILHALRPRRRKVVLSTTSLWREALRERQRGLGLQKLLRDLNLLLLLLIALLVSIGLADPRWSTRTSEDGDTVMVLDVSASMQAGTGNVASRSRFAALKRQAGEIIDALAADRRLSIVASGRVPRLHTGFETDRDYLHRRLAALQPTDESGRPRAALELALALIRNRERGRVLFLTDGAFDDDIAFATPQIEYRMIGQRGRNVAITGFDVRPEIGSEERYQVLLTVRNYIDERLTVPATITLSANRALRQRIELAPRARKTVVLPVQGMLGGPVRAAIEFDDDLAADNQAFAVIGTDERLHVLLYSEGNYYLESALNAMPNVRVTRRQALRTDEFRREARGHDIVVFDRIAPPPLEAGRYLLIDALAPGLPFRADGSVASPLPVGRGAHALVRRLDFSDLRIDEARRVVLTQHPPGLARLLWSPEAELALALLQQELRLVYLGFDLHDSNFPLQTAFPLFLNDSLAWLRPRETRHASTQSPAGEARLISLPTEQLELSVRTPSGEGLIYPAVNGRVLFEATSETGIYRYERALAQRFFAVNLTDERESDIRPRATIPEAVASGEQRSGESHAAVPLWPYLMAAALVLFLLEWGVWCWRPRSA